VVAPLKSFLFGAVTNKDVVLNSELSKFHSVLVVIDLLVVLPD
jgi:hypothetical protein